MTNTTKKHRQSTNLQTNKRALVLVLDGLGLGEMDDVKETRKQDIGAFTINKVIRGKDLNKLTNLQKLGLGNIVKTDLPKSNNPLMSYGKNKLAHFGADTFWGHQEIVGTKPKLPVTQHVIDIADDIVEDLGKAGHKVRFYNNKAIIIVDEKVIIGDNLEADPGWVISVTGTLDEMDFEKVLEIGKIVRKVAKTSRVNTHGGKNINLEGLLIGVEERLDYNGKKFVGHNVPKTGIYPSPHFRQIQLGYGVDPEKQVSSLAIKNNYPVLLIGKAGDVLLCNGATFRPMVQTDEVLKLTIGGLTNQKNGLIIANVQETDLSGHVQSCDKYFKVLTIVDRYLPKIIRLLKNGDLFIITGDHGNDPTLHSRHTREYTPLLVMIKGSKKVVNLGERETLADIGATVADHLGLEPTEFGSSFLDIISK